MKFKCKHCGTIFHRDMRKTENKSQMTKRGYKSSCKHTGRVSYCQPVKENR